MWLGGPQSSLFERRLSNIMGVHREVGFHPVRQHHHWWKLNERISSTQRYPPGSGDLCVSIILKAHH